MAVLEIAQIGDPILRQKARPLTQEELLSETWQTFIDDLIETMRHANGAGLAANQVRQAVQICAIEVRAGNPRYPHKPAIPLTLMVNPKLTPLSQDMFENYEGCLSVPNLRGLVQRYGEIQVEYWDREGCEQSHKIRGISAGTYQHETDHLWGKLFVDQVTDPKTLCTWEMFESHHRAGFEEQAAATVARYGS
jgi:peptide deformylase